MKVEMLEEQFLEFKEDFQNFIETSVNGELNKFVKNRTKYFEEIFTNFKDWELTSKEQEEKEKLFELTANYQLKIEKALEVEKKEILATDIYKIISDLKNYLSSKISTFNENVSEDQNEFHFSNKEGDSFRVKNIKKIKRSSFKVAKTFKRITKGKDYTHKWQRTIPLQNLITKYFINDYSIQLTKEIDKLNDITGKLFIDNLNAQKEIDRIFTHNNFPFLKKEEETQSLANTIIEYEEKRKTLLEIFKNEAEKIISSITEILSEQYDKFILSYKTAGTFENPISNFSKEKVENSSKNLDIILSKSREYSSRYFNAVFDRVEYYRDLMWFTDLILSRSYNAKSKSETYKKNKIKPIVDDIIKTFSNSRIAIDESDQNFDQVVSTEKESLITNLDQNLIVKLLDNVSNSKYNLHLENYVKFLDSKLESLSKNYHFVRPNNLKFYLDKDDLKEFSPNEILSPMILNKIKDLQIELVDQFDTKLSKLNSSIIGISRIVEFNLDSALSKHYEENENLKEAEEIALHGLDRSINKVEDIYEELDNAFNQTFEKLEDKLKALLEDLFSFSNIERLLSIKIQVSKEKAIQETKDKFQLYLEEFNHLIKRGYQKVLIGFNLVREKALGITSKVGLGSTDIELSEAMADYLVSVSTAIDKLPYVYKRLFSNEELSDSRIFIGRGIELAKLEKAYNYWDNQQISSVMLIGEKGSGTSSLINVALNKIKPDYKVYRKKITKTIYKENDLLFHLKEILQLKDVGSFDEIIESLNSKDERIIAVIENFEDFFLRTVDGFDVIKKLLEIITSTSRKVLWILTCNTFAWNYLDKVLNVKDFFVFNIYLQELTNKILEEIILVRHNISGYNITYLASEEIEKQKSFKKLGEKEKQEYLQKEYFDRLHKLASNNIGIALFMWLRSIKSASEEDIEITTAIELDFSFLKDLSDQKLFTIMAIILHDGLSIEEHSIIFNMTDKKSQLLFATLADDGIIFKRGNQFKVNFQLYKPLVNLLKSKNIIH